VALDVFENLANQRGILDAGDDAQLAPAIRAGLDIDKVN